MDNVKAPIGLDPQRRSRMTAVVKWFLIGGVLLFFAWLPFALRFGYETSNRQGSAAKSYYFLAISILFALWAAMSATALPRLVNPKAFGMTWRDPANALRDWLAAGIWTGVLYSLLTT